MTWVRYRKGSDQVVNGNKEEESSEEEEEEEEQPYARVVEPAMILGSSVPVSVPNTFISRTYIPPSRAKDKDVIISASFAGQTTTEEELSKSFDVPNSLNRRVNRVQL